MKNYVIGDLHGCGLELDAFIKQYVKSEDQIWLVGDLFDRSLHGHLVFKLIKQYGIKATLGNHEKKFINYLNGKKDSVPHHYYWTLNNLIDNGIGVEEFYNYIVNLPLIEEIDNETLVVHAGVDVYNPWQENESANVYGNFKPTQPMPIPKPNDGNKYWWDHYHEDTLVLYGHLVCPEGKPRLRYSPSGKLNSIGLDTAATHGGGLTAWCVEDNIHITVPSEDYFSILKAEMQKNPPKPHSEVTNWINYLD